MQFVVLSLILHVLNLILYLVMAWAIMSWLLAFNVINYHNAFVRRLWEILDALTEPLVRPIRRILPNLGGVDISPVILGLGIVFLQDLIIASFR